MPFELTDFETKRDQMTAFSANRAPELATSPMDWQGEQIAAQAQIMQSLESAAALAVADAVPTAESSPEGIAKWAQTIGLDAGKGPGIYGLKGPTAASGATGQITGTGGVTILAGAKALAPNGVVVLLGNNITLSGVAPGTGQALGIFHVDGTQEGSLGPIGNLEAGTVLSWAAPPVGIDPTFTLVTRMQVLGNPEESTEQGLRRIQQKMQLPPKGGAPQDYGEWVETAKAPSGQPLQTNVKAWRYPNYDGDGCPMVVATLAGDGIGRIPPDSLLKQINRYVIGSVFEDGPRPISHSFRTIAPFMPNARQLIIRARVVPSKGVYAFHWERGTTLYTVFNYVAGPPAVVTLNRLAPLDLKTAIDAGLEPKMFIDTRLGSFLPSGPPIPVQAKIVAWKDVAGKTELTLENPLPPGWTAPSLTGTEEVFSGGPVVVPAATSVLQEVNKLGPSKSSRLADPNQLFLWEDTLGVNNISTAIANTLDADGITKFVSLIPANAVTIAIGTNAPLSQDVTASDSTVQGPELLRAGRILITD